MPDYQKGKIYKLWSPQGEENEIYIGSTCDKLYKRKSHHKSVKDCKSKILFEKYDDIRIELIEDYPCNNKKELEKKEGEHIKNNKCLNKVIPCRTYKEYYEDNKEIFAEKSKLYREINKEQLAEKNKVYRENNKEKIVEKRKEYYENNKEKILDKNKEIITCECGLMVTKHHLLRHKKSKFHLNNIKIN